MGLIQQGARHRHPGVFKHRIPAGFLLVKPAPHSRAIGGSSRGGNVIDKVAEPLTERHHAQALPLAHPVEQGVELRPEWLMAVDPHRGGSISFRPSFVTLVTSETAS